MKRAIVLGALLAVSCMAGEWHGYLMDSACAAKMKDKAASHKAKCALSCQKGGYGIVTSEGKYVKFDERGNAKALEALKATNKDQDLMVKVTGTMDGDVIQVQSVVID